MLQRKGTARETSLLSKMMSGGSALFGWGLAIVLIGCASPGQPRPPSLRLPQPVADLTAQRVGDTVHLHWSTPSATTDNLPVPARLSAVICRQGPPDSGTRKTCNPIQTLPVMPGASQAEEILAPDLTTGPARLLAYRIEIMSPAGRSAGLSPEAFTLGGAAPAQVESLQATPVRKGIRLEWKPQPGPSAIELDRTDLAQAIDSKGAPPPKHAFLAGKASAAEIHLSAKAADEPDRGGVIDRSTQKGATYRYVAQRVQTVVVDGHSLTLRSEPSATVSVKVLDTFPPKPPTGLEAAPGGAEAPSIDLSWQPGAETDLAGYNVSRTELSAAGAPGSWIRLNSAPIPIPAFSDTSVRAEIRYRYRITALDTDGNESAPGNEVQETPGTR